MIPIALKIVVLAVVVAAFGNAFGLEASSCLSAKTAEQCREQVEEETGDPCVWCTCKAVPSECLGASLAEVDYLMNHMHSIANRVILSTALLPRHLNFNIWATSIK